ncbi:MAG: S-adenosylmethionine:tRNA ribosyltransferase-isomerase [Bacteroidota bacterium]
MKFVPKEIKIEDYNYHLPPEKIADFPVEERDKSKLLIYQNQKICEDLFCQIHNYIPENSLLVFNNSRVINARLIFRNSNGAKIEIFCLEPTNKNNTAVWNCLIGNVKRIKDNELLKKDFIVNNKPVSLIIKNKIKKTDYFEVEFELSDKTISFFDAIEVAGELPLPPYIKRDFEESDKVNYQTIYSKTKGSVAAPTAGLHFTNYVFEKLKEKKINTSELTLHVGAGTFLPVKSEKMIDHKMHSERIFVKKEFLKKLMETVIAKNKVIAVGTTSVRTIESIYWIGLKIKNGFVLKENEVLVEQWDAYDIKENISVLDSLLEIINYLDSNNLDVIEGETKIIIAPGYKFKFIDGLITNFHQPQSTLLLLISAFVGNDWKNIYDYALKNKFRFLSFGDSSILWKN